MFSWLLSLRLQLKVGELNLGYRSTQLLDLAYITLGGCFSNQNVYPIRLFGASRTERILQNGDALIKNNIAQWIRCRWRSDAISTETIIWLRCISHRVSPTIYGISSKSIYPIVLLIVYNSSEWSLNHLGEVAVGVFKIFSASKDKHV